MIAVRSAIFAITAGLFSASFALLLLPALAFPRRVFQQMARVWCRGLVALLSLCCGLRFRVVGRDNLPDAPSIIASKHQSAWDALIFHVLLEDPVYVLKRELLLIPFFGWYLRKAGNIAIDRAAGFQAIKVMQARVERAIAEGATVIIFPEGTRTTPGERAPYHPGIAAVYSGAAASVIPVALNSGLFWGPRQFNKRPGVITLEVLPAMPEGLPRKAFVKELERVIEEATARLCQQPVSQSTTSSREVA